MVQQLQVFYTLNFLGGLITPIYKSRKLNWFFLKRYLREKLWNDFDFNHYLAIWQSMTVSEGQKVKKKVSMVLLGSVQTFQTKKFLLCYSLFILWTSFIWLLTVDCWQTRCSRSCPTNSFVIHLLSESPFSSKSSKHF